MDTRELSVFVKVYETKSISQAARDLYLSPQGCSRIIQRLEAELEVSLFGRHHFGLKPTPQADILYQQASTVIEILDGMKGAIAQAKAEKRTFSVASTLGISEYLSPSFFRDFSAEHPRDSLRLLESSDAVAKKRLYAHEVEVAILGGPVDLADFYAIPFSRHRPCLVIHESNPLARRNAIAYEDLSDQPLAMMSSEFASSNLVLNKLQNMGVDIDVAVEANEIGLCHLLASKGEAIAISFDFAAWNNPRENTVIRPFEDDEFWWDTYLVTQKDTALSPQASAFREFAQRWLEGNASQLFCWPSP